MIKYKVESIWEPFIFKAPISGKLYIMPGWLLCDENTKLDEIEWVQPEQVIRTREEPSILIKEFKASKGDMVWQVSLKGKEYNCSCPGFQFRNRTCKHIKQVLNG